MIFEIALIVVLTIVVWELFRSHQRYRHKQKRLKEFESEKIRIHNNTGLDTITPPITGTIVSVVIAYSHPSDTKPVKKFEIHVEGLLSVYLLEVDKCVRSENDGVYDYYYNV